MINGRPDARRHRRALLRAASEIFLEFGITAPLELVVVRSGLGRATLYRHFPDRASLALALVEAALEQLEAISDGADTGVPPFFLILRRLVEVAVANPALADFWRVVDHDSPARQTLVARFHRLFHTPIEEAIAAGLVRVDLTPGDMQLVYAMLGTVNREPDLTERRSMANRILAIIVSGIEAPWAEALL
jgi:AcrR family transcriptional regulator